MSALVISADVRLFMNDVRFTLENGHWSVHSECLLWAKNGRGQSAVSNS